MGYFRGLRKQSSCIRSECTHKLADTHTLVHAVSPPRLVRAAAKPPPAEWLHWLHPGDVDIFVAFNHQTRSGRIHDQPRHLSTPPLLSRTRCLFPLLHLVLMQSSLCFLSRVSFFFLQFTFSTLYKLYLDVFSNLNRRKPTNVDQQT